MDVGACETSVLDGEKALQAVNKYAAQATSTPKPTLKRETCGGSHKTGRCKLYQNNGASHDRRGHESRDVGRNVRCLNAIQGNKPFPPISSIIIF